jgi:hypothetical protein
MTKADRANLERLARKRAQAAISDITERTKVLRAEVEDQLSAEYDAYDELWADLTREAKRVVMDADRQIAAKCAELGIPAEFRPTLGLSWAGRGTNAVAERRTELRRLAHARIDAGAAHAKRVIQRNLLEVETKLIADGLDSTEAAAFLRAMPTPEELMPTVAIAELDADEVEATSRRRLDSERDYWARRNDMWTPPEGAADELLAPTSALGRANQQAKRRAITDALASNPGASNREIARQAGVDHHTVGKLRGEMMGSSPAVDEDSPTEDAK